MKLTDSDNTTQMNLYVQFIGNMWPRNCRADDLKKIILSI